MTENLTLELVCGPDDRRCTVQLLTEPDRGSFVDCSLRIVLPGLDLRLAGLLFHSTDMARLRAAFDLEGATLSSPVIDSDMLLTIRAEQLPEWVEWSFEWEGIYPVFPPFDPDAQPNTKVLIRGLRTLWSPLQCGC
jgi:hypothetical protein